MQHLSAAASQLAQAVPPGTNGWATYGPLGLIVAVLISVVWFFIRRESARADRYEALLIKMIEANTYASRSIDSAHESTRTVGQDTVKVLEALVDEIVRREGKRS